MYNRIPRRTALFLITDYRTFWYMSTRVYFRSPALAGSSRKRLLTFYRSFRLFCCQTTNTVSSVRRGDRTWTCNLRFWRPLPYQLGHTPMFYCYFTTLSTHFSCLLYHTRSPYLWTVPRLLVDLHYCNSLFTTCQIIFTACYLAAHTKSPRLLIS